MTAKLIKNKILQE